ncbi:MAG: hypothetical protein ACRCS9_11245 [Hyphomicrobium sp.]
MTSAFPDHVNPIQWHHAMAVSRQACARIFRDGGSPVDALVAFGVATMSGDPLSWEKAVDKIANELCAHPLPRAA